MCNMSGAAVSRDSSLVVSPRLCGALLRLSALCFGLTPCMAPCLHEAAVISRNSLMNPACMSYSEPTGTSTFTTGAGEHSGAFASKDAETSLRSRRRANEEAAVAHLCCWMCKLAHVQFTFRLYRI